MRLSWRIALASTVLALSANPASADNWPTKPVRMVVPFPPGGATDAAARIYAQHLGDFLGQSVVVENKAGAGGEIGAEFVAKSAGDGYTLLMGAVGSHAIHAAMPDKPGYDFGTAFVGVSMATSMPMAVAVNSSKIPAKNVQELIALAKSKPGTITFGSAGPGTSQHMAGELFQAVTGTRLMHVPYRGSGPAITDLLGGQIDMVIETLPALLPQVASGKIRLLGVTTAKRATALPDLPTLAEQGVKDYSVATTYALLAPAGTPPAVVDKLSDGMRKAAAMESVQQAALKLGADAIATSPADTSRMLKQEVARWADVVRLSAAK
ncbi:tripartite tricarboxylate transporter substrate binding protein [Achromobacter sp.]|jgi:tripartite-type tricarboxylate transporter receptor subunit TctC|uniref:Bug family tripartite tricarboxylate transporter substrate binding protein n=1 Tax=Achromobacter sp. TaxID=134375 RepID=UPI0028A78A5C|nr:tripartite tricarboxylate transporter substrate binding protein [Achromobacter sp.]